MQLSIVDILQVALTKVFYSVVGDVSFGENLSLLDQEILGNSFDSGFYPRLCFLLANLYYTFSSSNVQRLGLLTQCIIFNEIYFQGLKRFLNFEIKTDVAREDFFFSHRDFVILT